MKCREIAAAPLEDDGSAHTSPGPAVRLLMKPRRQPETGAVEWHLFHDGQRVGTHAKVGRALLKDGDTKEREVAIKLRRDQPLGPPIDPGDASLRFWHEFLHHQVLRERSNPEAIPKVVSTVEHRTSSAELRPDVFPSCAICLHARHALALKGKGEVLREGDARGFERRLTSKSAVQQWWSQAHHFDEVLDATLGRDDSACGSCPHRAHAPRGCRDHLVYVNFYENEFLLFPIWEMSLEQLLAESNSEAPLVDARRHLVERLAVAHDVALGLRELHTAQIWHHDLNPENILIGMQGRRHHAAIIDLGLSSSADLQPQTSDASPGDASNLWPRRLSYASWECRQDAMEEPVRLKARRVGPDRAVFELNQSSLNWLDYDPPVCSGDRLVRVGPDNTTRQTLIVRDVERGEDANFFVFAGEESWAVDEFADFIVQRQRGPAADLFSFGMVMIALLLDHPQGRPIRRELERAQDLVASLESGPDSISPFDLATILLTHSHAFSSSGKSFFHGRLARYGPYEQLATRALGLAFSLALRGPARCGTVTVDRRMTDAQPALERVCKLLEEIFRESKTAPGKLAAKAKAAAPTNEEAQTRRDDETLPEDWRGFLPFWQTIHWDGKPQAKLLQYLSDGRLKLAPQLRHEVHEFLSTQNAIVVIRDFLSALIRFRESRPTGIWATLFRKSERQMPAQLSAMLPAAMSALEKLVRAAKVATAWVAELQNMYRSARDRWLKQRSAGEAAYIGKGLLRTIESYWEKHLPKAVHAWRLRRDRLLGQLRQALQAFRAWWPAEPSAKNVRKMTDADINEAARLSSDLLKEVIPDLYNNPIGPAGDVRASWILTAGSEIDPSAGVQANHLDAKINDG